MDERLEAGRHHLANGNRALGGGYLDDGRSHFAAALLQFRGPELRLGEAHALRGMAHVELGCGHLPVAEQTVREAIRGYQVVRDQLNHIDAQHTSLELRRDAEEGEGAALVLLGDLLMRLGRTEEARRVLRAARTIYEGAGQVPSAAGVWVALGRLYMRDGSLDLAQDAVDRAVQIQEAAGDQAGACLAGLLAADVHRAHGDLQAAAVRLDQALERARGLNNPQLEGRAGSQRAALLLQLGDVEDAMEAWQVALEHLRQAGDTEMEGFALIGLGECRSRLRLSGAVDALSKATEVLAELEHQSGLGAAMLQVAQHALRTHRPAMALAAAEAARQLWQRPDPVRGVGQALRVAVKALAGLNQWPAVLAASHLRAAVAGETQPNAAAVRDFYRARANDRVLADLDAMDASQLEARTDALIDQILGPIIEPLDLDPFALATGGGALALAEALVDSSTRAPAPERVVQQAEGDEEATLVNLPSMGEFAGLYTAPTGTSWDDADDDFSDG